MKTKKLLAILFSVVLIVTLMSFQTFAAGTEYTVTIKSNDGSETLWTQTVASGSKFEIMTFGARVRGYDNVFEYSGNGQFLGLAISANATTVSSFYAVGYECNLTNGLTLYVVDCERMGAHTIVGDPIEGADTYELWQKNAEVLKMHPELDHYMLVRLRSWGSNFSQYNVYMVVLSSHINDSCEWLDDTYSDFRMLFPEENKGVYRIFDTLEEAEAFFEAGDFEIENFTEILVDDTVGINLEFVFTYSTPGYIYSNPSDSVLYSREIYYTLPFVKISESSELLFDLDTLNLTGGSHTFKVKAKGAGYYDSEFSNELTYNQIQKYSVTGNFTNLTAYNNYDQGGGYDIAYQNRPFSIMLNPSYGYLQPDEIVVTMGTTTLKAGSGYWYDTASGCLIIPKVTGNITISAQGLLKVASPVIESKDPGLLESISPAVLAFEEVANASGYAVYIDGVETSEFETTVTDGVVNLMISKIVFPTSGEYDIYVIALPVDGYMVSNPSNTVTVDVTVYIAAAEIVEAPELVTDEHPYAFKAAEIDPQATGVEVYLDGVKLENVVIDKAEGSVLIPAEVFAGGDGSFEVYVIMTGPEGTVASAPSNTLIITIAKLATPEIRLE